MSKTYQCGVCMGTFECGWTDEEAAKEFRDRFGREPTPDETSGCLVCDDCYPKVLAYAERNGIDPG